MRVLEWICDVHEGKMGVKVNFQVADVNRALGSVLQIIAKGNRVVFDPSGSYVESQVDHLRLWLREADGVFVLDAWVAPCTKPLDSAPGFPGQEGRRYRRAHL